MKTEPLTEEEKAEIRQLLGITKEDARILAEQQRRRTDGI